MLNELIDLIYDAPLDSRPWTRFIGALRQTIRCDSAMITLSSEKGDAEQYINIFDACLDYSEILPEYKSSYIYKDPIYCRDMEAGKTYSFKSSFFPLDYKEDDFYQFCQRNNAYHALFTYAGCSGGTHCWLSMSRGKDARDFDGEDINFVEATLSHIRRALEIECTIAALDKQRLTYSGALAALGVQISDAAKFVSARPERMERRFSAKSGHVIKIKDGSRLVVGKQQGEIPKYKPTELNHKQLSNLTAPLLEAMLERTISFDNSYVENLNPAGMKLAFGLTRSEAIFASHLSHGKSLDEIAREMALTINSVRIYSKRLMNKLGCSTRSVVIAKLLSPYSIMCSSIARDFPI